MPKRNTEGIKKYNNSRGNEKREKVLAAIEQCKAEDNISTTRVCELANVHRSYFSKHPEMRKALDTAIGIVNKNIKKRKQNDNSKDVIIKSLYTEIASLNKEIASLNDLKKYKGLYEEKCQDVENLKKQLDNAYSETGVLDF